jgi:predicted nucleic acid-binding protein
MSKPTAYVDTNILSELFYRGGHVPNLARQLKTEEWWEQERRFYALVTSGRTEDELAELAEGEYRAKAAAPAAVRRLTFLRETPVVKRCAALFLATGLVPATKIGDAIQLAFATIHRIDYLLTWNHAHLANVEVQRRLDEVNRSQGWRSPLLVSPETIPWATLGQSIRRKDG